MVWSGVVLDQVLTIDEGDREYHDEGGQDQAEHQGGRAERLLYTLYTLYSRAERLLSSSILTRHDISGSVCSVSSLQERSGDMRSGADSLGTLKHEVRSRLQWKRI